MAVHDGQTSHSLLDVHDAGHRASNSQGRGGRTAQRRRPGRTRAPLQRAGADEMVFFDITATAHGRRRCGCHPACCRPMFHAAHCRGGIKSVDDMFTMLRAGATKSASTPRRWRIPIDSRRAEKFGSQCIVVSIDCRKVAPDKWGFFRTARANRPAWTPWSGPNTQCRSARRDCFEQH